MSTVYGAVKQNNGFIHFYSEPGLGTTFTIYFPRHVVGENDARSAGGVVLPAPRGQEIVLLVEDEPAILAMTTMALSRQGYLVLHADTPGKAIALAKENAGPLHLLVTDVVLPEMNGLELAEIITSLHPQIRRLYMSGYPAGVTGLLHEGVHFIHKPFSLTTLATKVREVLDGAPAAQT